MDASPWLDDLDSVVDRFVNDYFWTWLMAPLIVAIGVYFTVRSGFVQFRWIPEMFRTITDRSPLDSEGRPQSISAFQAFILSAASRVGVGNIAGVGTAIAVGGPGAVFWMWLMAFIGGATSLIESSIAQLFKVPTDERAFRGGRAFFIQQGLGSRPMAVAFSPS